MSFRNQNKPHVRSPVNGKQDWMMEYIKKLKICIKWFQKGLEDIVEEKDNLHTMLDSSEKKFVEAEAAMKLKEEEFNSTISKLENNISSLTKSLANEELQKRNAIDSYNKEREDNMSIRNDQDSLKEKLSTSQQNLQNANEKVKEQEATHKRLQEYITNLQNYNSKLQKELEKATATTIKVKEEKVEILANQTMLRNEFIIMKDSRDDAVKQKETAVNEVDVLRGELKELREDHECQLSQLEKLNLENMKYEESTERIAAECDNLSLKSINLEETCNAQKEEISVLQDQLDAANQELEKADLSSNEIRAEYEGQKSNISELEDRLREAESQLLEGERLRKKLHNTILELKGNIRVFCRVRPMLSHDAPGAYATLCYPTSVELAGRGIDIVQSGHRTPFQIDKVFTHGASQDEVFMEISQLVQSALDGYKGTEQQVQGVLNLIDLAGSERLSRSGATGDRLKETQAIDKSLSALSEVILALGKKEDHVPYRNSKLTYLLQPCLGGESKTLMFVNVSPDPLSVHESLYSLKNL